MELGTQEILVNALIGTLREIEEYERGLPRLLVCTRPESGEATYSGPIECCELGELILSHELASAGPDSGLRFSLEPLYPALDIPNPGTTAAASEISGQS